MTVVINKVKALSKFKLCHIPLPLLLNVQYTPADSDRQRFKSGGLKSVVEYKTQQLEVGSSSTNRKSTCGKEPEIYAI